VRTLPGTRARVQPEDFQSLLLMSTLLKGLGRPAEAGGGSAGGAPRGGAAPGAQSRRRSRPLPGAPAPWCRSAQRGARALEWTPGAPWQSILKTRASSTTSRAAYCTLGMVDEAHGVHRKNRLQKRLRPQRVARERLRFGSAARECPVHGAAQEGCEARGIRLIPYGHDQNPIARTTPSSSAPESPAVGPRKELCDHGPQDPRARARPATCSTSRITPTANMAPWELPHRGYKPAQTDRRKSAHQQGGRLRRRHRAFLREGRRPPVRAGRNPSTGSAAIRSAGSRSSGGRATQTVEPVRVRRPREARLRDELADHVRRHRAVVFARGAVSSASAATTTISTRCPTASSSRPSTSTASSNT